MIKKSIAVLLCIALALGITACKRVEDAPRREESAGTGYGTARSSALIEQDLYFLRPRAERSAVEEALGSPQSFVISAENSCTYRLSKGEELTLTYSEKDLLESAQYKDAEGKTRDLFDYLDSIGVILNYSSEDKPSQGDSGSVSEAPEQTLPEGGTNPENSQGTEPNQGEEAPNATIPNANQGDGFNTHFSTKRYSYAMAEQILKEGVLRETVVSAFGKPNGYGSVDYAKDGYIIDVYSMEDGSILYLDYGFTREKLRAARTEKGGEASTYLGEWGAEEKPDGLYRGDRNRYLFNSLKAKAKPSEIYSRFGAPDWLEGNADHYRDAYLLQDGSVIYLDFGANHSALTAASIVKYDGGITPVQLR